MPKLTTILIFLLSVFAVQNLNGQPKTHLSYKQFVKSILAVQTENVANKTAGIQDRLIGASWLEDQGGGSLDKLDSNFYKYNGTALGSALSITDDDYFHSYQDNSSSFYFEGLQDPSTSTLSYDTGYTEAISMAGTYYIKGGKTYDAAGYLLTYRVAQLLSSSDPLIGGALYQYTYDAAKHCTRILEMADTTMSQTGPLVPVGLSVFSKYVSGRKTQDSLYDYSMNEPYEKLNYTNNAAGKPTLVFTQSWNGAGWDNEARYISTYDAQNRLKTSVEVTWQGAWDFQTKDSFGYSGSGITYNYKLHSLGNSDSTIFTPGERRNVTLNALGAMDTIYASMNSGSGYSPSYRVVFLRNSYNHITSASTYGYTGSGYSPQPGLKTNFYYQIYNSTAVEELGGVPEEHLVSLYPNPVQRNEIHLKFGVMPKFAPSILILDNLGRVVVQKSIRIGSDVSFPIDNLASGQYYLRVSWDGREKVLGFVK